MLRMYLFYSPFHNFIHKTLVAAYEAGVWDQVTLVPTYPFRNAQGEFVTGQYDSTELNPLGKVPFLALDDGKVLYSSQVVAEYLDSLSTGDRLYPENGMARFDALRRLSLGDSVFEFAVQMVMESWRDPDEQRRDLFEWLMPKIERAYDRLEQEVSSWGDFDIGHAGLLQGLSFAGSWAAGNDDVPDNRIIDWTSRWPGLAEWFEATAKRPSVKSHYGRPYSGDDSPENFRKAVDAVLASRASG